MAKRGRRLGQNVSPRDERGWRIPRKGTIRRQVYDLILQGKQGQQIWKPLGISHASYTKHRQNIMRPDHVNKLNYKYANRDCGDNSSTAPMSRFYKSNFEPT